MVKYLVDNFLYIRCPMAPCYKASNSKHTNRSLPSNPEKVIDIMDNRRHANETMSLSSSDIST